MIALNYFDDKRIQDNDKITTYPYEYFDNDININNEIKNNTDKLNEIDNSGIIPKKYNTKDTLGKENTNVTLDINKIVDVNNDIYADSAKSTCIDNIKSTDVNYLTSIRSFWNDIIKSACQEIIKSDIIYADSAKSTCNDIIKSITIYADSAKSTCNDIIKSTTIYADSAKSTCNDIIKSTTIYADSAKSTCNDNIKYTNIKINKKNTNINKVYCKNINNKSAHSKINYELNAHLKLKKFSYNNIIIKKKLNPQVINIKYELNALLKLKKVTDASNNVIAFLKKHITQIIKGNKVHTHNKINSTTHVVIHDDIKKAHAKLTGHINKSSIKINKVHIENNSVNNANGIRKKTHKKLFKNVLKQIISVKKVYIQNTVFDYDKCKELHKELFNNVLIELKSTNNAGHKDSSANTNEASVNDTYANNANNNLLHNHML